jgi:exosome complex component RRP43
MWSALHPTEYYSTFVGQNVRPDGRGLHKVRKTVITSGKFPEFLVEIDQINIVGGVTASKGSAQVRIGRTSVLAAITAQIGQPLEGSPSSGDIGERDPLRDLHSACSRYSWPADVNVHLTPLCAPKFEVGRQSEQAASLSAFIKRVIVSSGTISFEDLCIQKGKSAWQLHADIICVDYDGNVIDASILALVAALKDLKLPIPVVQEDGEVQISAGSCLSRPSKRLMYVCAVGTQGIPVKNLPVPLTFGVFEAAEAGQGGQLKKVAIADPTHAEEEVMSATVTVVLNSQNQVRYCADNTRYMHTHLSLTSRASIAVVWRA